MGGTVAKLAESMAVITSSVVTNGGRSSNPFALTEQRMVEVRREEALRAAGVLGVKDMFFVTNLTRLTRSIPRLSHGNSLRYSPVFGQLRSILWMRNSTDIRPIALSASWREKVFLKQASSSAAASGRTKSGAPSQPGTALSTLTAMWPRRWPLSRKIAVRWPRYPMQKEY